MSFYFKSAFFTILITHSDDQSIIHISEQTTMVQNHLLMSRENPGGHLFDMYQSLAVTLEPGDYKM